MNNKSFKQIDLIRKRREEIFLLDPYFVDTKKYLRKGIYFGLSLISISIIVGFFFILRTNLLERKKLNIKNFVDEYNELQIKLNKESKELKEVAGFNENLKNGIANISSSSALLSEISLVIPKGIRIVDFNNEGNILTLKSELSGERPLELVNGFLISLDNSEFINFNPVDLIDFNINENENSNIFMLNIKTNISSNYKKINQKYLKSLGSYGLANRIYLLNDISN